MSRSDQCLPASSQFESLRRLVSRLRRTARTARRRIESALPGFIGWHVEPALVPVPVPVRTQRRR